MSKRKAALLTVSLGLLLVAASLTYAFQPYFKNRFLTAPFGEYAFTVFDQDGSKVAQGKLIITVFAYNAMQGKWRLHFSKNNRPHFEHRSGETIESSFAGEVRGTTVRINLNPSWNDANDFLEGKFENNTMRGEYLFYGFANRIVLGRFEAIRK